MNALHRTTSHTRIAFVRDAGFIPFLWTGKLSTAPRQIKHIMREMEPGQYLVNLDEHRVLGPIDAGSAPTPDQVSDWGFYWLLDDLLSRQGVVLTWVNDLLVPVAKRDQETVTRLFWGVVREPNKWWLVNVRTTDLYGPYDTWEFALEDVAIIYGLLDAYIVRISSAAFDLASNIDTTVRLVSSAGEMLKFLTTLASMPERYGPAAAGEARALVDSIVSRDIS